MSAETVKVILFGAGAAGRRAVSHFSSRVTVIAVADNDPKKQGAEFMGYPVIPPSRIRELPYDCVVVASMYEDAIAAQLLELGVSQGNIEYAPIAVGSVLDFEHRRRKYHALGWLLAGLLAGGAFGAWLM